MIAHRLSLTEDKIKWADVLIPIGGDGTFLLTASRSSPFLPAVARTPVIGFNSDPTRSEGKLMLPKRFSVNPAEAVDKILQVRKIGLLYCDSVTLKKTKRRAISNGNFVLASEWLCLDKTVNCHRPSICMSMSTPQLGRSIYRPNRWLKLMPDDTMPK